MSITIEQAQTLAGGHVYAADGGKVGSIGQVYLDDATEQPTWVTVKTGLFGHSETFVPLQGARVDGADLVVGYDQASIKGAPRVDPDGHLDPDDEDELYRYYRLDTQADEAGDVLSGRTGVEHGRGAVGHDTSGPTTDDAMTRSEERLRVGTARREVGRARLRKYVTTETVSQTVPVSHEEVRIIREPITDANYDAATSGPAFSEEEHEVILHAEVPVVQKTVVPVERVRVDTETVIEQVTVSEELRKEQIVVDEPTTGRR